MSEIFPAQDQSLGDVIAELAENGLIQDRDYTIQHAWDQQPYLQTTDEAYATWQSLHKSDSDDAAAKKKSAGDEKNDDDSGSTARRQTKRR